MTSSHRPSTRIFRTAVAPEKDAAGNRIDYEVAVGGGLQLIPAGSALDVPADDYGRMLADGMLLDADVPFEHLLEQCSGITELPREICLNFSITH